LDKIKTMSSRLDRSWSVLASYQTFETDRCIDIFSRPNGTFGFEEFRRDSEDMGVWTPISYFSGHEYPTEAAVIYAARRAVRWFGPLLDC
jgi:hypothetical protein